MTSGRKLMLLVERISGIVLPERELQRLTNWALDRAAARGFKDLNAYVDALRRDPDSDEWRILLSRVTVKESSLFRAPQQFRCLSESIIPELVASGRKSIQVWSAGCARGEEPATVAIVLAECLAGTDVQWSVLGTDVDADALEGARQARFSRRAVRRVPPEHLDRDFTIGGGIYELISGIRRHIEFGSINLVREPLEVPGQPFDVIFLRNVLIYFRKESQARVVRNIEQLLAPDGFLFIGPSESLMHLTPVLQAEERQGVFVYRRREGQEGGAGTGLKDDKTSEFEERDRISKAPPRTETDDEPDPVAADPGALAFEGQRAERKHDFRTALRCYRASLYLQPDLYQVRYRLGRCLEAVGWSGRAGAEFRAVLEILERGSGETLEIFDGPDFPGRDAIEVECREAIRSGSRKNNPQD
ncbi:MAG: methyltransferase domain-containing protein [Acidobacteria bacterium]|nr:methyltransferase domain-containing protein [Acidobacteriota bacterium]